jgi:hypothetical protein
VISVLLEAMYEPAAWPDTAQALQGYVARVDCALR